MSGSPTRPRISYSPASSPSLNEVRRAMRPRHLSHRIEASYLHYIILHRSRKKSRIVMSRPTRRKATMGADAGPKWATAR